MTLENGLSGLPAEQLADTLANIPCGLSVYRVAGDGLRPLLHNPVFYRVMGLNEAHIAQVEHETVFLGVHPDDLDELWRNIRRAAQSDKPIEHRYRMWNDARGTYRTIHVTASAHAQPDGQQLLYCIYSDVTEEVRIANELQSTSRQRKDIINAIPGGVSIYKQWPDRIETRYFSDGVPALTGYTAEEYRALSTENALRMIYAPDIPLVMEKLQQLLHTGEPVVFEFRNPHKDGSLIWVRIHASLMGEEDGCPLLHCVFHNISDLKQAQLEMTHLLNSVPGGIASYRVEGERLIPVYFSDGAAAVLGYTKPVFEQIMREDTLRMIYPGDRARVQAAMRHALQTGETLDVSYRALHRDGHLMWLHLNGRLLPQLSDEKRFYAVYTGISAETRLFQTVVDETADSVYVIDRENYELLYASESIRGFGQGNLRAGQKCYAALHGKNAPCADCLLCGRADDEAPHARLQERDGRFYSIRLRETDWNGIPAVVQYVQDVTDETLVRREKERLEQYFQTVLQYLPGGIGVIRHERDGHMEPEFLSDGFAAMSGMTPEQAWTLYRTDAMAGVHPDDRAGLSQALAACAAGGQLEYTYRLKKGDGSYLWVRAALSMIKSEDGCGRVYVMYSDMTQERAEHERLRRQYNELLMHHYQKPGPNALMSGHSSVTRNVVIDEIYYVGMGTGLPAGSCRDVFLEKVAAMIGEEEERQRFRNTLLSAPVRNAYAAGRTELEQTCFLLLPGEQHGRWARFRVALMEEPDTGELIDVMAVTDVTEKIISERMMQQLAVSGYDLVCDVDLLHDRYHFITGGSREGCYSADIRDSFLPRVLPRDRAVAERALAADYILNRLDEKPSFSFCYSLTGAAGERTTKRLTISATDRRLSRVCFARSDITDSVREQQRLLAIIAYTFDLLVLVDVQAGDMTLYSRRALQDGLAPYVRCDYQQFLDRMPGYLPPENGEAPAAQQFRIKEMQRRLAEKPDGYDFVLPYRQQDGRRRYKQNNVMWGDGEHKTICIVRADVTDMLAAERQQQSALEDALSAAEQASRAKSDFLSSMSHDIRTPMNAIIGMTTLAQSNISDPARVADCLRKIALSSQHLLELINDILDMNKIEHAQMTLRQSVLSVRAGLERLVTILRPQAEQAGLTFEAPPVHIAHPWFYGDNLRIDQILINLVGNAFKFTPAGGSVTLLAEELAPQSAGERVRYRFTVRDTGVGMTADFCKRLFEPFSRDSSAAHIEGSGLGLSITKGLVDLMGGTITVESRPGQGSIFRVELEFDRAAPPAEAAPIPAEAPAAALTGRRFLVAEDNAINAEILCELLKMQGAESVLCTDGAQALHTYETEAPGTFDAILMDIRMPVMNGIAAAQAIRATGRADAASIPIIAMTANAFAEDVQTSLAAGMNAHVAKPLDVPMLWKTLHRLLKD